MFFKQIITAILILFVAAGVVYLVIGMERKTESPGSDITAEGRNRPTAGEDLYDDGGFSASATPDISARSVIAYYFHGTKRCSTCMKIERYTEEAILEGFPQVIESGRLQFLVVNVDETENEHFIDDYRLTTKSVIISERVGGDETRWKNLDLVWEHVGDKSAFIDYVRRETKAYLGGFEYE